ncbi:MAG: PQQ-binding-like beta-propeller repeat protein [Armatimonadetes bacterium]|nr:PQQ-binding-like beta-propeller repeat protein [Armatimonadota bacterium]
MARRGAYTMNYRSRWQERRRKEAQKRLVIGLAVLVCTVLGVIFVNRLGADSHIWVTDLFVRAPVFLTYDRGVLYCSSPGRLAQALRLEDGSVVWPDPFRPYMGAGGPPVVLRDRILVFSDEGRLTSLDRRTGEPGWQMGTGDPIRCKPLLHDGLLYLGCDDGNVYAVDAKTGVEIWRSHARAPVNSGFAYLRGALVFGTSDGRIVCVNAKTGKPARWRSRRLGLPINAGPVPVGNELVFGTDGGRAYFLDTASGMVTRHVEMPGLGVIRVDPLTDGDLLYVASTDGWLVASDLSDDPADGPFEPRWMRDIGRELSAGPILSGGLIYCGNGSRMLLALDAKTGRIVHRWKCPTPVRGSIVAVGEYVIAGTQDGQVVAFQAPKVRRRGD